MTRPTTTAAEQQQGLHQAAAMNITATVHGDADLHVQPYWRHEVAENGTLHVYTAVHYPAGWGEHPALTVAAGAWDALTVPEPGGTP